MNLLKAHLRSPTILRTQKYTRKKLFSSSPEYDSQMQNINMQLKLFGVIIVQVIEFFRLTNT
jgi:hypothetical protein